MRLSVRGVAAALVAVGAADLVTAGVGFGHPRHPRVVTAASRPSASPRHTIVHDLPATLGGLPLDATATRTQFDAADIAALQRLAGAGSKVDLGLYSGTGLAIAAEAYTRGTDPDADPGEVLDGYVAGLRRSGQAEQITYPDRTDVPSSSGLVTCGRILRAGSPYGGWCAWVDRSTAGSVLLFGTPTQRAQDVLAELRSAVED